MENRHRTYQRQSMGLVFFLFVLVLLTLLGRLFYLMIGKADYYGVQAKELHERERKIKAERGEIKDCHGNVLAANRSVSTISVIHSQMKEPERVITLLSKELMLDEKEVRKKVEKVSLREKIKSNVDKETSDRIRNYKLAGVTVDEDYKREYRYDSLASKVLGFTGGDNQGIIGLEVSYEKYLKGLDGSILTMTTAYGTEIENGAEDRIEPVAGWTLNTSLDLPVMEYTDQLANYLLKKKQAKSVDIIVMNPQNGEILAEASYPNYDLNHPRDLTKYYTKAQLKKMTDKEKLNILNDLWNNYCVSNTYEPGSTFKPFTISAGLELGDLTGNENYVCGGVLHVGDHDIHCSNRSGHGPETLKQALENSCNVALMQIGESIGTEEFCRYQRLFWF